MNARAMMGVGTLIVFIASILIAAVAAGVVLRTGGVLQSESLRVGRQAETSVTTHYDITTIRLFRDTYDNNYDLVKANVKLGPASPDIRFNQTSIMAVDERDTVYLRYNAYGNDTSFFTNKERVLRGNQSTAWRTLRSDIDRDFREDRLRFINETLLSVNISATGVTNLTISNIENATTLNENITITYGSNEFGTLEFEGSVTSNTSCAYPTCNITIHPPTVLLGIGVYDVEFLHRDDENRRNDAVTPGDVTRISFELMTELNESEEMLLSFKGFRGQANRKRVVAPDVFQTDHIHLYP